MVWQLPIIEHKIDRHEGHSRKRQRPFDKPHDDDDDDDDNNVSPVTLMFSFYQSYCHMSVVALLLIKATILEEMPPFPERESSILAKLKKKRPDKVANNTIEPRGSNATTAADGDGTQPTKPSPLVRIM